MNNGKENMYEGTETGITMTFTGHEINQIWIDAEANVNYYKRNALLYKDKHLDLTLYRINRSIIGKCLRTGDNFIIRNVKLSNHKGYKLRIINRR